MLCLAGMHALAKSSCFAEATAPRTWGYQGHVEDEHKLYYNPYLIDFPVWGPWKPNRDRSRWMMQYLSSQPNEPMQNKAST